MGLIKIIIILAICVAILWVVVSLVQVPSEEYDCLKEIAENYCEDNGMEFRKLTYFIYPGDFTCVEDERSVRLKFYKFLEDEIEGCKD